MAPARHSIAVFGRQSIDPTQCPGPTRSSSTSRGSDPFTINPGSRLPQITEAATIDGTSQPGFAGAPIVELNGTGVGGTSGSNGLEISGGSGSTIRGLVINRFNGSGVLISASEGGNKLEGNYIGTDPTGAVDLGNVQAGIYITTSPNNTIGGTNSAVRNVISGNHQGGIEIAAGTGKQARGQLHRHRRGGERRTSETTAAAL